VSAIRPKRTFPRSDEMCIGTSRYFVAVRDLVAIGALRTWASGRPGRFTCAHAPLAGQATASDHRASPIPPDGQFAHGHHAPFARRANMPHADALAASGKSPAPFRPSCGRAEGRFAIVTNVGCGMRWTRERRETSAAHADGEVVWSWRSNAGVKRVKMLPASHGRRWQPSNGHRGEHEGHR
jgi:hypothetical protein